MSQSKDIVWSSDFKRNVCCLLETHFGPDTVVLAPVQVMAIPLLIQLLVNMPVKAVQDGTNIWAAATHLGDAEKAPGSCL